MTTGLEPRRLRADAARNRKALLDAAERMFARHGLAVTLDSIATEAGVNVATAYRHFANKHELARAFLEQQFDEASTIAEEAAANDDPWLGMREFLARTLELMVLNRGVRDVIVHGYASEQLERFSERITPVLLRLIERGQQAGAVRDEIEPGDLGVILQMLAIVSDVPTHDESALRRRYLEMILSALRPSTSQLPGTAPTTSQASHAFMNSSRRPALP